jgi:hypothetical protein
VLEHFNNPAVLHQAGVRSRQKNFRGSSKKSKKIAISFLFLLDYHTRP